jgi:hypothetical protein
MGVTMATNRKGNELPTYGKWAPCALDTRGLGLPEQQDWLVVCSRTRDSEVYEESNFACAEKRSARCIASIPPTISSLRAKGPVLTSLGSRALIPRETR